MSGVRSPMALSLRRATTSWPLLQLPNRHESIAQRRHSKHFPLDIPAPSPNISVSPKDYLEALSRFLAFANRRMRQGNVPALIEVFNDANMLGNRRVMRDLADAMLPVLTQVQAAYYQFCDTQGTFTEDEIWRMVLGLGDDGSEYWDMVDELGDLIEIMEGDETEAFWISLEEVENEG